ncbi:regulator of telomere elongation helicase 1 homolog isoform X2 [Telopea speciosissima]|uniref:regulator of telomere elongation helicase 1 homolog isoform X2 n=1 Tax=Telopea speciosissima TaxID=54955 RepID=UPI001CC36499|nr:regulator of telomere elongation helicase 1 homolog isoform X2 [Telopea speciosissima]
MPTYKIRGIDVDFPFEAYDCQLVYMEKVIQSLQDKCNALLESPTGTGKTLCLLCATLAWRKSLGPFSTGKNVRKVQNMEDKHLTVSQSQSGTGNLPTIVYTSRTHSQLQQVIQELKRTSYRPKMVVLGSREQLCIHDEVRILRGRAQTNACHSLCRGRKKRCTHYTRVADYVKRHPNLGDDPIDIEDLVNIGRTDGACPYYTSRELHKIVDILFAPYNYLIDRKNCKTLSLQWHNSVLIFDEAHNLESICADAASFDIPSGLLSACISEAQKCVDLSIAKKAIEQSNDKALNPDNFAILKALLLKLEKRIAEVPIESKELGFTRPGSYVYELLADLNIKYETASMLIDTIEVAASLLEEDGGPQKANGTVCRLESMGDILYTIFRDGSKDHAKFYQVHVQEVEVNTTDVFIGKASRIFSWWCFNPGMAMERFSKLGVGSIILTSGTLSPLDSFAQELKIEFPVQLENPHVISSNQIWAGVVSNGPSGCSFNSSYRNRDSLDYKQDLGNAIVNFARIVPDGLLVFFPSYYLLDQFIGCWKTMGHTNSTNSSTIWERICRHKQPVVEPRQSSLFPSAIEDFMTKLKDTSTSGAVFFAVCRGKVSEGLDFADHAGRAVVITGIPFAMRTDPKIRLKREYLDQQAQSQMKKFKVLTGEEWYRQQASRAVNQAVGRVIRHSNDYGAIILCDERFMQPGRQGEMSLWIRPYIKCYPNFGDVVFTLTRFFRNGGKLDLKKSNIGIRDAKGVKVIQPQDKFLWDKSCIDLITSVDGCCSEQPLSSVLAASRGSTSSQLGEILPANRSTLTPCKKTHPLALEYSGVLSCGEKKLWTSKRKDQHYHNCGVIDLTIDSQLDEKPSTAELVASCSSKKPKILETDSGVTQYSENSLFREHLYDVKTAQSNHTSIKLEKHRKLSQPSAGEPAEIVTYESSKNMEHAQVCSVEITDDDTDDDMTTQKVAKSSPDRQKDVHSSTVSCVDEEKKGSDFLIQVQENLSAVEYKEFVGFMKALKSKTMKINHVLQSIASLFSAPGRFLLLKRFKDYIPEKYRPIYEQHLRIHEAANQ